MIPVIIRGGVAILLVAGSLLLNGITNITQENPLLKERIKTINNNFTIKQDKNKVNGKYKDYDFEADITEEPTSSGIENGRIYKLIIKKKNKIIESYKNKEQYYDSNNNYKDYRNLDIIYDRIKYFIENGSL